MHAQKLSAIAVVVNVIKKSNRRRGEGYYQFLVVALQDPGRCC